MAVKFSNVTFGRGYIKELIIANEHLWQRFPAALYTVYPNGYVVKSSDFEFSEI